MQQANLNINVAPLIDVFLVLIATVLVVSGDISASAKVEIENQRQQADQTFKETSIQLENERKDVLQKNQTLTVQLEELKSKIARTKHAEDDAPKTDKKQLLRDVDKLKKELLDLKKFANNKVTIDVYFSNSGKIYFNESEIGKEVLADLVSLGFRYNISMQSTEPESKAYSNFYQFCEHANSYGYKYRCK